MMQDVSGLVTVTGDLECVRLSDEGCLRLDPSLKKLKIGHLINEKEDPCVYEYDILVTGEDGEDGAPGSGENGRDGGDGGDVEIEVGILEGDLRIRAAGGRGGNGGSGKEGPDGGNGGRGGNGGNGANVVFRYGIDEKSQEMPVVCTETAGGSGGRGGSGGNTTSGRGTGGEPGKRGGRGGRFGSGGNGGRSGQKGKVTVFHPDGGKTVNGWEYGFGDGQMAGNSTYRYCLENDWDYRVLLQTFGGRRELKKRPALWNALQEARHRGLQRNAAGEDEVQIDGGFIEVQAKGVGASEGSLHEELQAQSGVLDFYEVHATYGSWFSNSRQLCASGKNTEKSVKPAACMTVVSLYDEDTKEILYRDTFFEEKDLEALQCTFTTDAFPASRLMDKNILLTADLTYETREGGLKVSHKEQSRHFNEESFIDKIRISAPKWHDGKSEGDVIFLYGRTPSQRTEYADADYYGGDYLKDVLDEKKQLRTIIPISGSIQLKDINKIKVEDAHIGSYVEGNMNCERSRLLYQLQDDNPIVKYRNDIDLDVLGKTMDDNGDLSFDKDTLRVDFDLKLPPVTGSSVYDWEDFIQGAFIDDSVHKCFLHGCFVLDVHHSKIVGTTVSSYQINIYSVASLPADKKYFETDGHSTTVYIPPIMIYWGCYAGDTKIRMADGQTKPAQEICCGDVLAGMNGKELTVADILQGNDDKIYHIWTADGNQIRVSGGHAMWAYDRETGRGKRRTAHRLQEGDGLMMVQGVTEITKICEEPYHGTVYNFTFENEKSANYLDANGFWSGDFYAQNQKEETIGEISEKTRAVIQDMRSFSQTGRLSFARCKGSGLSFPEAFGKVVQVGL